MKKQYYSVKASQGQNDEISFHKEDGNVIVHMGYEELSFTTKEIKELIDKLKLCVKE